MTDYMQIVLLAAYTIPIGWLFVLFNNNGKKIGIVQDSMYSTINKSSIKLSKDINDLTNGLDNRIRNVEHVIAKDYLDKEEVKELLRDTIEPIRSGIIDITQTVHKLNMDLPKNYATNESMISLKQELKEEIVDAEQRILERLNFLINKFDK